MTTKKSNRRDVDDLLADLDNLGALTPASKPSQRSASSASGAPVSVSSTADQPSGKPPQDAQSLLDDLDSLVQSRATSSSRASQRRLPAPAAASDNATSAAAAPDAVSEKATPTAPATAPMPAAATAAEPQSAPAASTGGWGGWGSSLFSHATKLADQARAELEKRAPTQAEQARELGNRGWDLAKGVRGFVKEAGLEKWGEEVSKVGKKGWTDIVNAVAPPIAAHEVIQVTLSHDMVGYDGIEDVTYRVLAKVMEQVDSDNTEQQLVVNKAPVQATASRPKQGPDQERDLNAVEGLEAAFRLASASLDEIVTNHQAKPPTLAMPTSPSSVTLPITTCPVFVRIQACLAPLPGASLSSSSAAAAAGKAKDESDADKQLYFVVLLKDPLHGLSHKTISQAIPNSWLQVPFEENAWVEDSMVDVISTALSVVGQDYVQGRMSGRTASSHDGLAPSSSKDASASASV
ncbi:hypothetical protein ACQY0O_004292 [Thecaphora frezii]